MGERLRAAVQGATVTLLTVSAGVGAQVVTASPAAADTYSPSGCYRWAYSDPIDNNPNWGWSCTVGWGYVQSSGLVLGVQHAIQGWLGYPTPDATFGSQTYNAIRDIQSAWGLQVDGIVGASTWKNLQSNLFVQASNGFGEVDYSSGFDSSVRFHRSNIGRWYTIYGIVWVHMES